MTASPSEIVIYPESSAGRFEPEEDTTIYRHAREGGFLADLLAEIKILFGPA